MNGFGLAFKAAKEGFLDRQKVIDAVGKAELRVFSRFGAFVRTRAKSSIRKRKKASDPGKQPSSHVGTLKQLIFFSYDKSRHSVVTGPTLSNQPSGAPENLEYGGDADLSETTVQFVRGKREATRTTKRIRIRPRPFMGPAFQAEKPKLPSMWANSVR